MEKIHSQCLILISKLEIWQDGSGNTDIRRRKVKVMPLKSIHTFSHFFFQSFTFLNNPQVNGFKIKWRKKVSLEIKVVA